MARGRCDHDDSSDVLVDTVESLPEVPYVAEAERDLCQADPSVDGDRLLSLAGWAATGGGLDSANGCRLCCRDAARTAGREGRGRGWAGGSGRGAGSTGEVGSASSSSQPSDEEALSRLGFRSRPSFAPGDGRAAVGSG
jgi:hypothetical protein